MNLRHTGRRVRTSTGRTKQTLARAGIGLSLVALAALGTGHPLVAPASAAMTMTTFSLNSVGVAPQSGLVEAPDHNFYGTTFEGGAIGAGMIYRLTAAGSLSPIFNFPVASDGSNPMGNLIEGRDGKLYGTTSQGGSSGCGTVFSVKTDGTGFTVLHSFGSSDGCNPYAGVAQGSDGYLYGTTYSGSTIATYLGTIYRVSTAGTNFSVLRTLASADGANPRAGVLPGPGGKLYGTTSGAGPHGGGTAFAIATNGSGYTILHAFSGGSEGYGPTGSLIRAKDGYLYGTTNTGGANNDGTIFKVNTSGTTFATVYSFGASLDSEIPEKELLQASDGQLYGTTHGGPNSNGCVFKVGTTGTGYTLLHTFVPGTTDGGLPLSGLLQADDGTLYGTTQVGGINSSGTAYRLSLGLPAPKPTITSFSPTSGPIGSTVRISGSYFVGATSVTFNGTPAQFTVLSGGYIVATVPAGATTGPISVTTPAGTRATATAFTVT